ncbi:amidohydrolase family protein [Amnibacterium setariae]|uniref:amidohydrolase family protein n=1 Tax=Amnibacterium setariae TaxID=2306585 RepID=UPI0013144B47|nr:amidohydrolase family protein [Amnibacterium setariae]
MAQENPFVDAHVHFWDRSRLTYPWLEEAGDALPARFLPEDLDALDAVAEAVVFVQADCVPEQGVAEAAWAAELVRARGGRGGVVAFAPVEDAAALPGAVDALRAIDGVVGVRRLLQDEPEDLIRSDALAAGLRGLAAAGLTFDACVRHHQLDALLALRRAAPDAAIVLDHLGKPPVREGWGAPAAKRWHAAIRALAAEPGTTVKLSGLAPEAGPGPVAAQVRPFLEAALEAFGADRCMAGSDFPVSAAPADAPSYGAWFDLVAELAGSPAEQDAVLAGTARRVYGLG